MRRLILASTSPRRRELLARLGLPFECQVPDFEEVSDPRLSPEQEALEFSRAKALSLAGQFPDALLIGSDTLIAFAGKKLGKPRDAADALVMLRGLAGRTHRIYTGVGVYDATTGTWRQALSEVVVTMRPATEAELAAYVATGEPLDKAGAYAIQGRGRNLIAEVQGDYFAAVGLPLGDLARLLAESGMPPPISVSGLHLDG